MIDVDSRREQFAEILRCVDHFDVPTEPIRVLDIEVVSPSEQIVRGSNRFDERRAKSICFVHVSIAPFAPK